MSVIYGLRIYTGRRNQNIPQKASDFEYCFICWAQQLQHKQKMTWAVGLLVSLLMVLADCQYVDIKLQAIPGDTYCGYLRCAVNSSQSIVAIKVYDITEEDNPVRLVSASIFNKGIDVEEPQIHILNATGAITLNDGYIGIGFAKAAECLYRSFQCELDYVDGNGKGGVSRANLIGSSKQNATVLYALTEIMSVLREFSLQTDKQLKTLQQSSEILINMLGGGEDSLAEDPFK